LGVLVETAVSERRLPEPAPAADDCFFVSTVKSPRVTLSMVHNDERESSERRQDFMRLTDVVAAALPSNNE
jgi:hypothetical protein